MNQAAALAESELSLEYAKEHKKAAMQTMLNSLIKRQRSQLALTECLIAEYEDCIGQLPLDLSGRSSADDESAGGGRLVGPNGERLV